MCHNLTALTNDRFLKGPWCACLQTTWTIIVICGVKERSVNILQNTKMLCVIHSKINDGHALYM